MSAPSTKTIKRLFALSSNRCAFPDCTNPLFDKNGILVADVCHIAGDKPGAKRYDPVQTEEQRQGFNNLIVLCANHHRIIDSDEAAYTRPALRQMKRAHEASATEEFVISDGRAEKIAIFLGGAVAGTVLSEIAREAVDVIRATKNALQKPEPESGRTKHGVPAALMDALRYAPRGTFYVLGTDEPHKRLGEYFIEVFKAAGWRFVEEAKFELSPPPQPQLLVLSFVLRDPHQVSNAREAIEEVFTKCGFKSDREGTVSKESSGYWLRIAFAVNALPR